MIRAFPSRAHVVAAVPPRTSQSCTSRRPSPSSATTANACTAGCTVIGPSGDGSSIARAGSRMGQRRSERTGSGWTCAQQMSRAPLVWLAQPRWKRDGGELPPSWEQKRLTQARVDSRVDSARSPWCRQREKRRKSRVRPWVNPSLHRLHDPGGCLAGGFESSSRGGRHRYVSSRIT